MSSDPIIQELREKYSLGEFEPTARPPLVAVPDPPSGSSGSTGSTGLEEALELDRALKRLAEWFRRFINLPDPRAYDLLALWAGHTWAIEKLGTTPRLLLHSLVPEAGKTTLLDHLDRLCLKPLKIGQGATAPLLAHCLKEGPRTLLLDEVDRTLDPKDPITRDRLAILNTGYKRGGNRPALVARGKSWEMEEFPTFAPVAIAGNSPQLPDDTRSRCIEVRLLPALGEGAFEDSDWEEIEAEAELLREALAQAVERVAEKIGEYRPPLPEGCTSRNRERWLPLKRVAAQAGGDWEQRVDDLIEQDLEHQRQIKEEGLAVKRPAVLLAEHLSEYYQNSPGWSPTEKLREWLVWEHPETWGPESSFGRALTVQRLGRMLSKDQGIFSQRPDTVRGYYEVQFLQVWQALSIRPASEPERPEEPEEPEVF